MAKPRITTAYEEYRTKLYEAGSATMERLIAIASAEVERPGLIPRAATAQKEVWKLILTSIKEDSIINMNNQRLADVEAQMEAVLSRN